MESSCHSSFRTYTKYNGQNSAKHSADLVVCVMDHVYIYRLTAQGMQGAMNRHLAEGRES